MHTKFEDEKGFIEDCKVWAKTGFIFKIMLQDLPTILKKVILTV